MAYQYKPNSRMPFDIDGKLFFAVLIIFAFAFLALRYKVVVLEIDRAILTGEEKNAVLGALDKIENDFFVKGVVLKINSNGATADAGWEMYHRIAKLAGRMPVIAYIDSVGASGGYLISLPAQYIYAKPASEVGSIGAVAGLPQDVDTSGLVVSGPFKLQKTGEMVAEQVEIIKNEFLKTVVRHRGGKIKIEPLDLLTGEVYIGIKAKEIGLVDEFGSTSDAVARAADMANLLFYATERINPFQQEGSGLSVVKTGLIANSTTIPVYYHIYVNAGDIA